jgi:hypothetical protein
LCEAHADIDRLSAELRQRDALVALARLAVIGWKRHDWMPLEYERTIRELDEELIRLDKARLQAEGKA